MGARLRYAFRSVGRCREMSCVLVWYAHGEGVAWFAVQSLCWMCPPHVPMAWAGRGGHGTDPFSKLRFRPNPCRRLRRERERAKEKERETKIHNCWELFRFGLRSRVSVAVGLRCPYPPTRWPRSWRWRLPPTSSRWSWRRFLGGLGHDQGFVMERHREDSHGVAASVCPGHAAKGSGGRRC